jgi:hypothetical protein
VTALTALGDARRRSGAKQPGRGKSAARRSASSDGPPPGTTRELTAQSWAYQMVTPQVMPTSNAPRETDSALGVTGCTAGGLLREGPQAARRLRFKYGQTLPTSEPLAPVVSHELFQS